MMRVAMVALVALVALSGCGSEAARTPVEPEKSAEPAATEDDPGVQGPLSVEDLYAAVPSWRGLQDAAEIDAEAVEAFAAVETPTEIAIYLGSWCSDSRDHVPRLIAAIDRASNPNLRVSLTGLTRGFAEPAGLADELGIERVPTVVVSQSGREIGRFIETPRGESVEGDIAVILRGPAP